jgi:hypothetical protein
MPTQQRTDEIITFLTDLIEDPGFELVPERLRNKIFEKDEPAVTQILEGFTEESESLFSTDGVELFFFGDGVHKYKRLISGIYEDGVLKKIWVTAPNADPATYIQRDYRSSNPSVTTEEAEEIITVLKQQLESRRAGYATIDRSINYMFRVHPVTNVPVKCRKTTLAINDNDAPIRTVTFRMLGLSREITSVSVDGSNSDGGTKFVLVEYCNSTVELREEEPTEKKTTYSGRATNQTHQLPPDIGNISNTFTNQIYQPQPDIGNISHTFTNPPEPRVRRNAVFGGHNSTTFGGSVNRTVVQQTTVDQSQGRTVAGNIFGNVQTFYR